MNVNRIEKLLEKCDLQELYEVEKKLSQFIISAKENSAKLSESEGRNLRTEDRFKANIHANLIRITDVKPNERKEYSVTVQDISKSGMCFLVDTNFIPSRIVELTFAGPGGKIKRCHLEVVRMRKLYEQSGNLLEVGCRSISNEELRRARLHEERIAKMRSKLHNKKGVIVFLVGPDNKDTEQLFTRIKIEEYQIKKLTSINEALASAERLSAQLLILADGGGVLKEPKELDAIRKGPSCLAVLAIVDNDSDRFELFKAGIDECLMRKSVDEFLLHAVERALVGHAIRQQPGIELTTPTAMLYSRNGTRINLITFRLEEQGFKCKVVRDIEEAQKFTFEDFHLILADFSPENVEEFHQLCHQFNTLPIIATCDRMDVGHLAMANGAHNYLCMPPSREDIMMILEEYLMKKK